MSTVFIRAVASLFVSCTVLATFSGSVASAQGICLPQNPPRLWSTASGWAGGLPTAGSCVTIPCADIVIMDVSPPPLAGLDVQGELRFSTTSGNLTLESDWIRVQGKLEVGTTTTPFPNRALIRLAHSYATSCNPAEEDQTLAVDTNGVLTLHGNAPQPGWTKLAQTAFAGDTSITVQGAVNWQPGDSLVIASTDFDPYKAERVRIASISGSTLTLTGQLANDHWGATEGAAYDGVGVEERAEVGVLNRNVIVEGTPFVQSGKTIAGQTRFEILPLTTGDPLIQIDGVEFRNLGKQEQLGRYPVHFHHLADATGSYFHNSSIHTSFNRWLAIHETQNVDVQEVVAYDTIGHGYYFEDESVTGCVMQRCLGVLARKVPSGTGLHQDDKPAVFWLDHPDNYVANNSAAGSDAYGFWFEADNFIHTPWSAFGGNVAHSHFDSGFFGDDRPAPQPVSLFTSCLAYKNRRYGYWLRNYGNVQLDDCDSADNRGGYYLASEGFQTDYFDLAGDGVFFNGISKTRVTNSLVIGVTTNHPTDWPQPSAISCSPLPAWEALTGVELYDGLVGVEDTVFAAFADATAPSGGTRKAGAFSPVYYASPWMIDPRNYAQSCTFVNSGGTTTNPVWLRQPAGVGPCSQGDNGVANTMVYDLTGSITGTQRTRIVANTPYLIPTTGATFNSTWHAWVVPPPVQYAQLDLDFGTAHTLLGIAQPSPSLVSMNVAATSNGQTFACYAPTNPPSATWNRFPHNALADDTHTYTYPGGVTWAKAFFFTLQFTAPGKFVLSSVQLAPPTTGYGVFVFYNGVWTDVSLTPHASLAALQTSTGNGWFYDSATQRIHLRLVAGTLGGTTVFDNQSTSFLVWSL